MIERGKFRSLTLVKAVLRRQPDGRAAHQRLRPRLQLFQLLA